MSLWILAVHCQNQDVCVRGVLAGLCAQIVHGPQCSVNMDLKVHKTPSYHGVLTGNHERFNSGTDGGGLLDVTVCPYRIKVIKTLRALQGYQAISRVNLSLYRS